MAAAGQIDLVDPLRDGESGANFKVVIRVRPPLERELNNYREFQQCVLVEDSQKMVTISENLQALLDPSSGLDPGMFATYRFTFDRVFDQDTTQQVVYEMAARPAVHSTLQGYNAAVIAYGQTGTGKTYTMEGSWDKGPSRGIIPRSIEEIFTCIQNDIATEAGRNKYLVRASYLQIYNEVISDLLKPERTNLTIREDRKRGVYVDKLSEWVVRTPDEVYGLMERGSTMRATGATKLNELSSRSHAVLVIIVEKSSIVDEDEAGTATNEEGHVLKFAEKRVRTGAPKEVHQSFKVGKLNLVDLAGSERVGLTGASGKRLEESKNINKSLSSLGNVIAALTDSKPRTHIPYRDSKLTRILEDSLGGNCKTTMFATVTPALEAFSESLSTLKFANRAKNIKNTARINEDLDQRALLRKYERELKRLRGELEQRTKELVDKRQLLELEEAKKLAEQDKLAAMRELEEQAKRFMEEKTAKAMLEEKIRSMQSQLLLGGAKPGETNPAFKQLIEREKMKITREYEERLKELEKSLKEKESQEQLEDSAQVERYKQLLLKQRDIMIALTARLNERDEQILTLQEELEAYDRYQRKLEDRLDTYRNQLFTLRKVVAEAATSNAAGSDTQNTQLMEAVEGSYKVQPKGAKGGKGGALMVGEEGDDEGIASEGTAGNGAALAEVRVDEKVRVLAEQLEESRMEAKVASRQLGQVQGQVDSYTKEREALKTILDQRMRPLMDDIATSLQEVPGATSHERLPKQVKALNRLLQLTVDAMQSTGQWPPLLRASLDVGRRPRGCKPRRAARRAAPRARRVVARAEDDVEMTWDRISVEELASWDEEMGPPTPLLDTVNYPIHLKNLSIDQLRQLTKEIRADLIHTVSKTGGHLGSSLGVAELTVALHHVFNSPEDRIIFDVGHQAYVHKMLTGRRSGMSTIRQSGGLSGFTKRSESEHDPFGAGHSSTSISAAVGMAAGRDFKGKKNSVIAVIGDGAITGGMAYEAMNHAGFMDKNMIVILNDNQQVSLPTQYNGGNQRPVGALSGTLSRLQSNKQLRELREVAKGMSKQLPTPLQNATAKIDEYARGMIQGQAGTLFEELGLYYIGPIDGHSLEDLIAVLQEVKSTEAVGPVLIHIVTEKGRGYIPAESASDKMHGVVKYDLVTGQQYKPKTKTKSYTQYFAEGLIAEGRRDSRVVGIHAAMGGGTGMNIWEKVFPDRTFDVGIAEQHAVTFAAGLATEGMVPTCAIYSTFLQRGFDQVVHDVALQKLPVRFAMDRAGLVGADGATHCGAFDITYMACLPHMIVMAPSNEAELLHMVATSIAIDDAPSCYRFPRGNGIGVDLEAEGVGPDMKGKPLEIGKGRVLRGGKDVALLGYGSSVNECLKASEILAKNNVQATVADARFCKPLDTGLVRQLAKEHSAVIIVEEGSIGGFGSHVLQFMALDGLLDGGLKVRPMCLPDRWIDHGAHSDQLEWAGLTPGHIASTAMSMLGKKGLVMM
ncbi:unnamed protein product [Pedinophyceae sp. YPF-701]|nr:unnamed protein product [Pedinophyceae sp. YPF-701]